MQRLVPTETLLRRGVGTLKDPDRSRVRTVSPATLRQQAAISRELGNVDLAYCLERTRRRQMA
jgi:hypothetical protein